MRELYDRGMTTDEAVKQGISTTAGTVTSAAVVMVGVFAVFITLAFLDFKELGLGMAAAILIDATIIRGVLPQVGEHCAAGPPAEPSELPIRETPESAEARQPV